MMILLRN